jgi:uncharacterized membrane protein YqgA involved in biofilm formation
MVLDICNWIMAAAFLFSVIVQYNDPDPIRWMVIYGLALSACILSLRHRLKWQFSGLIALAALLWASILAPHVIGKTTIGALFESFHMTNEIVEEARETGGLLIVALWMLILSIVAFRAKQPSPIVQS